MNSKMVKTIFIVAGLFNIGGVLMFSMFFTNGLSGKYFPEVMGNFGLIGIMLWGLAYCAVAPGIRENRWPALVFAFEKMVIDKNFLFVGGSILSALLCVKNILPQDVGYGTNDPAEGALRHPSF